MVPMNPFDLPPLGDPVSFDPPQPSGPRRGRTALVAVLTAGLIGGGIAGISQLASADRADLAVTATATPDEPNDDTAPPATTAPSDDDVDGEEPTSDEPESSESTLDTSGQIVLDDGDGDPIVIDLGDLGDGDFGKLTECLGFPMFDFDIDVGGFEPGDWQPGDLPNLDEFLGDLPFDLGEFDGDWGGGVFDPDGGSVTVTGPDGVSVVDLGENGSVTITKENGEVTISTDGDATVGDLTEVFGDFGTVFEGGVFDEEALDEFLDSLPDLGDQAFPAPGDLPDFEPVDPDAVQACLDEALGN